MLALLFGVRVWSRLGKYDVTLTPCWAHVAGRQLTIAETPASPWSLVLTPCQTPLTTTLILCPPLSALVQLHPNSTSTSTSRLLHPTSRTLPQNTFRDPEPSHQYSSRGLSSTVVNVPLLDGRAHADGTMSLLRLLNARGLVCRLESISHALPCSFPSTRLVSHQPRSRSLTPSQEIPGEGDDSRVGSARDGAEGGTLSKALNGSSSSAASLLSTLLPVLVYSAVCILLFGVLRRRLPRVYRPRTMLTSLLPQCVSSPSSSIARTLTS